MSSFLNNIRGNKPTFNDALTHRGFTIDEEKCKRLINQVFENYVLADREIAFSSSFIKCISVSVVVLSAILMIVWIWNYMIAKKQSKNAPQPGTNIIENIDYTDCIPFLLQKLNEAKIEGIEKHKELKMKLAERNNDFEIDGESKCVISDELNLQNLSEDDNDFQPCQSTASQSQSSTLEEDLPLITCAVENKEMPRQKSGVRVSKI